MGEIMIINKKFGLVILLGCIFLVSCYNEKAIHPILNLSVYSIRDLKQLNLSGSYNTYGYIVKIYQCPGCPTGYVCKPCMRDNIVISQDRKLLDAYQLSDKDLIIFVNNTKQFIIGKEYMFSIRITEQKSTSEPINDAELMGWADYLVGYDLVNANAK